MRKSFDLGVVLSVTSGVMLTRDFSLVHEVLDFLTGDKLFTDQLPRAARAAGPFLLKKFPKLAVDVPENVGESLDAWIQDQKRALGSGIDLDPMPAGEWAPMDPFKKRIS